MLSLAEENKPQLDHIQADFVTPQVLGVNNHHKNTTHRLNGVLPRMNITPNPLAQEADKVFEIRIFKKIFFFSHKPLCFESSVLSAKENSFFYHFLFKL